MNSRSNCGTIDEVSIRLQTDNENAYVVSDPVGEAFSTVTVL